MKFEFHYAFLFSICLTHSSPTTNFFSLLVSMKLTKQLHAGSHMKFLVIQDAETGKSYEEIFTHCSHSIFHL
jgi:hypothetical protein